MSKYLDPVFQSPFDSMYEIDLVRNIEENPWRNDLEQNLKVTQTKLEHFSSQVDDSIAKQTVLCEVFKHSLLESQKLLWNQVTASQLEQGKLLNHAMINLQKYQQGQELFSEIICKMTTSMNDLQNQVQTLRQETEQLKKMFKQDDLFLYSDHTNHSNTVKR
jgi:hypothetical protein